jgi:hypothetical protein
LGTNGSFGSKIERERRFDCPFCSCYFFTEHDLALHLNAFSDKGEAHKEAFQRLHVFVEEHGTFRLNDNFTEIEFKTPEQRIGEFETEIKKYFGLGLPFRQKIRKRGKR